MKTPPARRKTAYSSLRRIAARLKIRMKGKTVSYRDQVNLWKDKASKYQDPHFAETNTLLKQSSVDHSAYGHWMSMCFKRGTRVYIFEGQANRDRFVNQYRHTHEAKPCKDPLK